MNKIYIKCFSFVLYCYSVYNIDNIGEIYLNWGCGGGYLSGISLLEEVMMEVIYLIVYENSLQNCEN